MAFIQFLNCDSMLKQSEWEEEKFRSGIKTLSRCFTEEERDWVIVGGRTNGQGKFQFLIFCFQCNSLKYFMPVIIIMSVCV